MAEPRSTYRLQLHAEFGFDAAAAVADYLRALGVSHAYCSPYLQAAQGSTHGYDVVDPTRVNDELGGPEAHARMLDAFAEAGLGQVLDVVPNHMSIADPANRWWWDVLENGPAGVYAAYFDVDWDPPEQKLRDVVLLPVLGDHYGRVLEAGELNIRRDGASFVVAYFEQRWPVAPRTLDTLLASAAAACGSAELESIAAAFGRLPLATDTDRDSVRERHRDKEVLRERLAQLIEQDRGIEDAVDAAVDAVNADADVLDELLERQNYRLARWQTAGQELDYRRFFDITTLVGLRVEDDAVFDDSHALVLRLVHEGAVDGLRVDHPDGLRDPEGYLRRLHEKTNGAWVAVEKILEPGERLPSTWPAAGTTGYDFLNAVAGLFVDPAGEEGLTKAYAELVPEAPGDWAELVRACKHEVLAGSLAADVRRVTARLVAVCEGNRCWRDYTRAELSAAVRELVVAFPVYRTYVTPAAGASADDRRVVGDAVAAAGAARPDVDGALWDLMRSLLTGELNGPAEAEFVASFQQLTGPAMAKGVEDTAFYRYGRLLALNEVGGAPDRFGTSVDQFHALAAARAWGDGLLATSTHDTKRSEDVRARLVLLSEMPDGWRAAVDRWMAHNRRHKRAGAPDANFEYLFYQSLVGAWPLPVDRALAYAEKASREAKVHTSWTDPDPTYDEARDAWVEAVLADPAFVADVEAFVAPLVPAGRVTALAQSLVKLTAPGVADVYQGCELWDLSLVDPDNRRPVDYGLRRRLLQDVASLQAEEVMARSDEGLPKLLVTTRALHARPAGAYEPLAVAGAKAASAVAFTRSGTTVTVVPRLVIGLGGDWADTTVALPAGEWRNTFTGDRWVGTVALRDLLARFPVALLTPAEEVRT